MPVIGKSLLLPVAIGKEKWIEYRPAKIQLSKTKATTEEETLLRKLQQAHLRWAETQCNQWGEQLRLSVELYSVEVFKMSYGEFIDLHPNSQFLASAQKKLGNGYMHWYFEYPFAQALLNRWLGGKGYLGTQFEAFTMLETLSFENLIQNSQNSFENAWQCKVEFENASTHTGSLKIQNEILIQEDYYLCSFTLKIANQNPVKMSLGYSQKALEHLMNIWNPNPTTTHSVQISERAAKQIFVPLKVRFGYSEAKLNDLLHLQTGDILLLQGTRDELLEVNIGADARLLAKPGISKNRWSIQLEDWESTSPALLTQGNMGDIERRMIMPSNPHAMEFEEEQTHNVEEDSTEHTETTDAETDVWNETDNEFKWDEEDNS